MISFYFTIRYLILSYYELFVSIKISFISILFIKGRIFSVTSGFVLLFSLCMCAYVFVSVVYVCGVYTRLCECECATEARRERWVSCSVTLCLTSLTQTDVDMEPDWQPETPSNPPVSITPPHTLTATGAYSHPSF